MGYDLKNINGKEFRFNSFIWPEVLNLAMYFGWKPKGTYLPDHAIKIPDASNDEEHIRNIQLSWDGRYTDKKGQIVTEEDTYNLAFALMTALKLLPDEYIEHHFQPIYGFPYRDEKLSAMYCRSGKSDKVILKDLIHFCMGGEFNIR